MVIARGAILHCSTVAAPDCKEGRFTITCKLRLVCPVSPDRAGETKRMKRRFGCARISRG
jgi:hypothetical protein